MPCAAFQTVAGELDVGGRAACTALGYHIPGATFALPALGRNTQFELNLVKTQAGTCVAGDFAVGDSVADADDHWIGLLVE